MSQISIQRGLAHAGDRKYLEETEQEIPKGNQTFGISTQNVFKFFEAFLGYPSLRTVWEIQNAVTEFELEIESFLVSEEKIQVKVELLANNNPIAITLIEFKVKARIKAGEPSFETIPFKQYILESYTPTSLVKAESLTIRFSTVIKPPPVVAFFFSKSKVGLTINQEFHA